MDRYKCLIIECLFMFSIIFDTAVYAEEKKRDVTCKECKGFPQRFDSIEKQIQNILNDMKLYSKEKDMKTLQNEIKQLKEGNRKFLLELEKMERKQENATGETQTLREDIEGLKSEINGLGELQNNVKNNSQKLRKAEESLNTQNKTITKIHRINVSKADFKKALDESNNELMERVKTTEKEIRTLIAKEHKGIKSSISENRKSLEKMGVVAETLENKTLKLATEAQRNLREMNLKMEMLSNHTDRNKADFKEALDESERKNNELMERVKTTEREIRTLIAKEHKGIKSSITENRKSLEKMGVVAETLENKTSKLATEAQRNLQEMNLKMEMLSNDTDRKSQALKEQLKSDLNTSSSILQSDMLTLESVLQQDIEHLLKGTELNLTSLITEWSGQSMEAVTQLNDEVFMLLNEVQYDIEFRLRVAESNLTSFVETLHSMRKRTKERIDHCEILDSNDSQFDTESTLNFHEKYEIWKQFLLLVQKEKEQNVYETKCVAVRINEYWGLTSAHCVQDNDASYRVTTGDSNQQRPIYSMVTTTAYKNYIPNSNENDIALLQFPKPLNTDGSIASDISVCFPSNKTAGKFSGSATYFGLSDFTIGKSLPLDVIDASLDTRDDCKLFYRNSFKNFCTKYNQSLEALCVNTGGVLFKKINNKIVLMGIATKCGSEMKPVVYTEIAYYMQWIDGIVNYDQTP